METSTPSQGPLTQGADSAAGAELKVKKAAPKKKRKGQEEVVVDAAFLAAQPLLGLLPEEVRLKIASRMQHHELARDEVIYEGAPMEEEFSPVYLVLYGDVAIYRTTRDLTTDALREEVSNYISVGELYIQKLHCGEQTKRLQVRAMCPVRLLSFTYQELNYLLSKSVQFRDAVSASLREVTRRQARRFDDEMQRDISAFFVRERLTFARRVKIKRMDICIECDGCYDACRTRHGTDRLGASEVKYGITEIPSNCHNCVVPECIDKCKFGHITRHEQTSEIVISDNCVGCQACSKGCSFNAIQMHPVEALDLERYFPDRDPEHKGKKIAQKCDNCSGYSDQACITACPTGAMFQVDGPELFNYWEQFNVHKNPGFDAVVSPEDGANRARPWWAAFTLLNLILLSYESLTRAFAPQLCFGFMLHEWGLFSEPFDESKALNAGKAFGHTIGYIGTVCMLITQLYTVGKKLAPRFGSVQAWMEVHIWFGFLGFIYGFYHTAFSWREPVAVATFALFTITVLTGVVGRYLVFHVPRNQAGEDLALADVEARLQALNESIQQKFKDRREGYTMMVRVDALRALQEQQALAGAGAGAEGEAEGDEGQEEPRGLKATLARLRRLVRGDQAHEEAIDALRAELGERVREGQADEVLKLMKEKARLSRGATRAKWLSRALKSYKVFHVSIGHLTFAFLALHILKALGWVGR
jgi:Fe-S-cluster-containing hydrogenase component 2